MGEGTMSKATRRFKVNEPDVIEDVIDGEAIIADLGRGLYFSLDDTGSRIWSALTSGTPIGTIVTAATAAGASSTEEVQAHIDRLLDELQAEALITPDAGAAPESERDLSELFPLTEAPFSPPTLSKYSDMEQLLMLDPIHDVDISGWPNSPESPPSTS
jgi:hypothetical protein